MTPKQKREQKLATEQWLADMDWLTSDARGRRLFLHLLRESLLLAPARTLDPGLLQNVIDFLHIQMLPQFCCQDIILGFFKCCKIDSCHLRYINSLFLTQNTYNSLCHIFPVKNSMDIGSADIFTICTVFLTLS